MKKIRLTIISMLFSTFIFAQQGTITGTVMNGSETLIGASIIIANTSIGTITDNNGVYTLLKIE